MEDLELALPTMRAGITGREFLRIAGGFGAPALGTSPAGGLDVDNAGNLATDGDVTAKSLTVEEDTQQWKVETRVADSDKFIIQDVTNGQDVVEILPNAGSERIQIGAGETVFNQAGLGVDHRFEGDTEVNVLFVDASSDYVGIGTNTPGDNLHVKESSSSPCDIRLENEDGNFLVRADGNKALLFVSGIEFLRADSGGRIGLGGSVANAAVMLDMTSTNRGFRPPQMTTTQRNAIGSPVAGMMIYNTTTKTMQFHNGTAWGNI